MNENPSAKQSPSKLYVLKFCKIRRQPYKRDLILKKTSFVLYYLKVRYCLVLIWDNASITKFKTNSSINFFYRIATWWWRHYLFLLFSYRIVSLSYFFNLERKSFSWFTFTCLFAIFSAGEKITTLCVNVLSCFVFKSQSYKSSLIKLQSCNIQDCFLALFSMSTC